MLDFNKIKLNNSNINENIKIEETSNKDIAIIGVSLKMPEADTTDEFWNNLRNGVDSVRKMPDSRKKDAEDFLRQMGIKPDEDKYIEAAYLNEIDKFDYSFFKLSPKEASLMDPNQRIFLQTAWSAIEDAGYGGKKLKGSRTGVYLGFGSDPEYKNLISKVEPDSISVSLAGNVRPIIASRLSYILDFRGPSLLVDTTCSSSLVAIHLACQAIRNGECELAIAGAVQVHLRAIRQTNVGVESSDGRAKTFDDKSDGTGTGEGSGAILLKPLSKALRDGDNIYAVIKGSAINHDGASIGLTAPNAVAQEDVIVNAWKDAGINPETITYIEAHGTGTKLGDPIEVDGIQRAFEKYTDKKAFCAVGSIKTNIGHLDNSAGIASVLKAVFSLKNKEIPPSLHFNGPNKKISFETSPVYVNDKLSKWEADTFPRRCGVSGFGLSGTNCHIVLEESPKVEKINTDKKNGLQVLTLSAISTEALKGIVKSYANFDYKEKSLDISNICYTSNTGRGHYDYRLAILIKNEEDFENKIKTLNSFEDYSEVKEDGIFYGKIRVIQEHKETREPFEFTDSEIKAKSIEANAKLDEFIISNKENQMLINEVCSKYVSGAEIKWEELYKNEQVSRVSIPGYAFEKKRCWIEPKNTVIDKVTSSTGYPLLDFNLVESMGMDVYSTEFSIDRHWMLNEHRIMNDCVLVGTTYLEIAIEACKKYFGDNKIEIKDVTFLSPMVVKEGEARETHTIIKKQNSFYEFAVVSKLDSEKDDSEAQWIKHVEGKISDFSGKIEKKIDLDDIKEKYAEGYFIPDIDNYNEESAFEFGPRWKNISEMYLGEDQLLSHIKMPKEFVSELKDYTLYPSVLDNALATMPLLNKALSSKAFSGENGIFLPFSYRKIKLYKALPAEFYSYVKLKTDISDSTEMITFDLVFADVLGNVFAEIDEYSLKKSKKAQVNKPEDNIYYEATWIPSKIGTVNKEFEKGNILIFKDEKGFGDKLKKHFISKDMNVIQVSLGTEYSKDMDGNYTITSCYEDYLRLIKDIKDFNINGIIHMLSIMEDSEINTIEKINESQNRGIKSLFYLTKSLQVNKQRQPINLTLIAENVNEVSGEEKNINPQNSTLFGLGKVVKEEIRKLSCSCIDIDLTTTAEEIIEELKLGGEAYQVALRNGNRYIEEIQSKNIEDTIGDDIEIKDSGVYVITGGTGGIGLEMAKYLAAKNKVNIALLNRSDFPEHENWDNILDAGDDIKLCNKINLMKQIEESGSKITCCKVDVSKEQELKLFIEDLHAKFGRINGVIHSAGVAGDGFMIMKDESTFDNVLAPKIKGTWLLDELTKEDNLDFFVMFSSNNTLMGVPGQGDYTAANTFLCAYSEYRNMQGRRTVTINWPAWKETGMAVNYGVNFDNIFKALPTAKALDAFDKVISSKFKNIIVGELNIGGSINGKTILDGDIKISDELRSYIERKSRKHVSKSNMKASGVAEDVKLKGKDGENFSETELRIAAIWKEVLGFEEFDIYDNFFDIGGDSILITKVHTLIEKYYPDKVSVADLFSYTTISKLAQFISGENKEFKDIKPKRNEAEIEDEIISLLDELENGNLDIDKAIDSYLKL